MKFTQPIRNKRHVSKLKDYYLNLGEIRNFVLIVISLCTALRISDILRLRWDDVYDFTKRCVLSHITITEKKTKKTTTIALHKDLIKALKRYSYAAKPGAFIILNKNTDEAIGRVQAYRLIKAAGEAVELQESISCHSLRKTFGYHAWKDGTPHVIIMELYNHSSMAITRRYLGISQDDKDAVYLGLNLTGS